MTRTALFSLHDISGADRYAEDLIKAGWRIIGSRETVELLRKKGLPVCDIADFVGMDTDYGFPPTLHPKVEFALTVDCEERIDLVYVVPYPLSAGNDIGGRTLLGLAVKGGRIAVMDVGDMEMVVREVVATGGLSLPRRRDLANKACFAVARHYLNLMDDCEQYDALIGSKAFDLLNGENPYQVPASAFAFEDGNDQLALLRFERIAGELPCYTNLADADSILRTLCISAEAFRLNLGAVPYMCIAAKHGNACGFGISFDSSELSVKKALFGNARAVWGGEVITNFSIDDRLAELLMGSSDRERICGSRSWMLDLIMAPSFEDDAIKILCKRARRKLLTNRALRQPVILDQGHEYRFVRGGFLKQPQADYIIDLKSCKRCGEGDFSRDEQISLIIAWAVAFSSNHGGNEIVLAKNGELLGVGGGPSTIEATQVAISRARDGGHNCFGSVFAGDAFFPFVDVPMALCEAGVVAGCVPEGGRQEAEVKAVFRERGVKMAYLAPEFRGFCRH